MPSDVVASSQAPDPTSSGAAGGEVTLATLGLKIGDQVIVDATSAKPKVRETVGYAGICRGTRVCLEMYKGSQGYAEVHKNVWKPGIIEVYIFGVQGYTSVTCRNMQPGVQGIQRYAA